MTPEQIQNAYNSLQTAVAAAPVAATQQVADGAAAKAPGLAVGSNAYDIGRYVTPTTQASADQLVVAAKQGMVRTALADASAGATDRYTQANTDYQTRQRQYYRDQAIAAKARQDAQDAAASAAANPTSIATGDNDVDAGANGSHFIGNNDFRGVLNYNASKGDKNAALALKYVGNDGKFNLNPSDPKNKAAIAALNTIGAKNVFKAPAPAKPQYKAPAPSPFVTGLTSGAFKNPLFR